MIKDLKKLASLSSIYSIGVFSEKALTFLLIPLYTAYLFPEDLGIIGLMTITVGLMTSFLEGPINAALLRYYYEPTNKPTNKVLIFNFFLVIVGISIFLFLVFFALSPVISSWILGTEKYSLLVRLYSLVILLTPFSSFLNVLLRVKEMAKYYAVVSFSKLFLKIIVIIFLVIFGGLGVYAVPIGQITGLFAGIILFLPVFIKSISLRVNLKILKEPLTYSTPLIFSQYSQVFMQSGDRYVIKYFSSLATVGIYSFGYQLSSLINFLLVIPINQALMPLIMQKEANPVALKKFVRKTATYYYTSAVFIALGLSFFSHELFSLIIFNNDFLAGLTIFPILAFAYVQHGLGSFLNAALILTKKSKFISLNIFYSAALNIILNIVLFPVYGIIGAAFATLISYFVLNLLKIYYSKKFYNLTFETKKLTMVTCAAIVLYIIPVFFFQGYNLSSLIISKSLLLVGFALILFFSGFLEQKEKTYILDMLRTSIKKLNVK